MKCRLALALLLTLCACDSSDTGDDGGSDVVVQETGADTSVDATSDVADASTDVTIDAFDASDASDAFVSDAALTTSQQISAVRVAASTAVDGGALSLPIDNAIVTYVRPVIGSDVAGFFVQAEKTGPALFVAVDPATLSPAPVPGDQVSFVVTSAALASGMHEATSVTTFTRTAQGTDLSTLLQDLSTASDTVSNVDGYEAEYITLGATLAVGFSASGTGFEQAQITTTGLTGNAALNLRLRLPTTVVNTTYVDSGCKVTVTGVMFRLGGVAQPSGYVTADLSSLTCNAPQVKSAVAASNTSAIVTFDHTIDSATLLADGSQFTFDNGLTASAATATSATQITVTTSTQVTSTIYTVTAASSLKDKLGTGIDGTKNHASFSSFSTIATLQLNEINPAITSSLDLVELLALTSGNVTGITLEQDIASKTTLATLPTLAVTAGDLIVVHLGATTATTETGSQSDCSDASCYAGAWDVKGGGAGITYSGRVLVVRSPSSVIQDAAAFYTGSPPSGFSSDVMSLQSSGVWLPADCAGFPCNTNTLAETVSVVWTGCGSSASGSSVARKTNVDTSYAADWAVGSSSFGSTNP